MDHDRHVIASPSSWFGYMVRETAHFGDCKAVDNHGRVFARSTSDGSGAVVVSMDRGDCQRIGNSEGLLTPDAAIALAERYSWRSKWRGAYGDRGLAVLAAL